MNAEERRHCESHQQIQSDIVLRLTKIELWIKILAGVIVASISPGATEKIFAMFASM
jgi:hypothetical protein